MSESSKSRPDEYDSITYHHWQEFELRRLKRSSDDFQQLFEDIMVRARPGFIRVRPYGNIGDRKCDGLFRDDSIFFQVYSPDELEQAKVQKKIDEDLNGAVAHWGEALKEWIFVYNVRRGLPPDIPGTLQEKQKQYPDIKIAHLSNDDLWEITRGLSLNQRSEILGAPPQWNFGKLKRSTYTPNLPSHFLERSTEFDNLKNLVISSSSQSVGITGTAPKVGVHGMGGIGKSVLAAILARDKEVQVAFPDGVFWITLGQEPVLTLRQLELAEMLDDTYPTLQDVQQGKIHLSQLLEDRTCLLILDDVWKVEQVAAFNVLSEQSKLLFTTRDSCIVKALDAVEHQVDFLSNDEALELLAVCSEQKKESLPLEAHGVVKECGNLPLAISMIGAIARARPNRWENLLHKLQNADLDRIRHQFPDYPYPDLLKAIQVSVDALEPEVRIRYFDFAVFQEDVAIPEAALKTFWEPEGLDKYDTQDIIDILVERSLARHDDSGNLTLHDLQYDYVRKQITDLPTLHNRLLDAYATHCPYGWHTGLSDGYFFENLAFHLIEAERKGELYRLLVESPDWMKAKFIHCKGDLSYVADIEMAVSELSNLSVVNQILLLVKLNTAHKVVYERNQYDRDYLETLAWLGREEEAINYARLTSHVTQRYVKLLAIYDVLQKQERNSSVLLDELWQTAKLTQNDGHEPIDTWALGKVAARLYASGRQEDADLALSEAEVTALSPNPDWLYYTIAYYALDNESIDDQAGDGTEVFTRDWLRVEAIRQLAVAFSNCGKNIEAFEAFMQAKQIAIEIDDSQPLGSSSTKSQVLERLGKSMLEAGYLEETKVIAQLITDAYHSAELWCDLGIESSKTSCRQVETEQAFEEAEKSIHRIANNHTQAIQFAYLSLALAKAGDIYGEEATSNFNRTLQLIETLDKECQKPQALAALVNYYALASRFTEAKEVLQKIEHRYYKNLALRNLAVEMATEKLPESEQLVRTIFGKNEQIAALAALALAFARLGNIENADRIFNEVQKETDQLFAEEQLDSSLLHDLALTLITAKDFPKAEKIIESIDIDPVDGYKIPNGDAWHKGDVMIDFAIALAQSGNKAKSYQLFQDVEKILERLETKQDKLNLYKKLELSLIDVGYLEKANEASKAISEIVIADVKVLVSTPIDFRKVREVVEKSTSQLLSEGNIKEAFTKLGRQGVINFLRCLARKAVAFEDIEQGLSVSVLREALYIVSWILPKYQRIHKIIQSVEEFHL